MGSYMGDLEMLVGAMKNGLPASTGYSALEGLVSGHKQQVQTRRADAAAASQDLLNSLISTAQSGAQDGQGLAQIRPMLDSLVASSGIPVQQNYAQIPGIDPLFSGGFSAINPTLDPEDQAVLTDIMRTSPDKETARQTAYQTIAETYPEMAQALQPQVDALVDEIFGTQPFYGAPQQ